MENLYILMPVSGIDLLWPGLVALGLAGGVIGGFFGLGGAWIFAPGLYILGFPMTYAVGTTIAEVAGKSLLTTLRHGTFKHLDLSLGLTMLCGTVLGVEAGAQLVMWLDARNLAAPVVLGVYALLLAFLCCLVLGNLMSAQPDVQENEEQEEPQERTPAILQKLRLPPVVHYKKSGFTCSVWGPLLVCLFTGFLAGFLGIGGGVLRMPALVYLAGFPTQLAQGTDIMEGAVSGIYGACSYALKMRVEPYAALILIFCAAVGNQVGTLATRYARGRIIRATFGLTGLVCLIAVVLKLVEIFFARFAWLLSPAAIVVLLGGTALIACCIVWRLLRGYSNKTEKSS